MITPENSIHILEERIFSYRLNTYTAEMKRALFIAGVCLLVIAVLHITKGARSDQVLLQDVKVLTLRHGQMTNARRSAPVPQLKCVGGTAGCDAFRPQTVQCINKGSDGYDVQWECKADMDNKYRFGNLEVTCEGYNYPDDPYILRGSCGLEYTLDLTEEGHQSKGYQHYGHHDNHHDNDYHYRQEYSHSHKKKGSSIVQDLIYLGIIAGIIYIVYKTCIAAPATGADVPPTDDRPRGDPPSYEDTFGPRPDQHGNNQSQPPPYGFRQDYMPNTGESCSSGANYSNSQTYTQPGGSTGGGFWSGLFSGGIMGYLLGNRGNNSHYGYQRPNTGWWGGRRGWGTGWGNGWGTGWGNGMGGGWGNGWGSSWGTGGGWGSGSRTYTTHRSSAPSSSGTRTASGFASTRRR